MKPCGTPHGNLDFFFLDPKIHSTVIKPLSQHAIHFAFSFLFSNSKNKYPQNKFKIFLFCFS